MVRVIVIQGNIGSGKSTWVNHLKEKYINRPDICFLQEPVNEWLSIKDANGVNALEHYYNDQQKYAFMFQMMAYISRLTILKRAIESNLYRIIITERCLFTDRNVFCKMLYDDGLIDIIGYQIYNKWFDEFMNIGAVHYKHIYLRTDPVISKMRVDKRARKEETIPLEYLAKCHNYHDRWLLSPDMDNVVVIDANQDTEVNPDISHWNYEVSKFV
jgi:deoxycitidine kinase/deoxyguanosine kinase